MPNATLVNLQIIISVSFELMFFTHKNRQKSLYDSGIETFKNACFMSLIRAVLFYWKRNKISMILGSVFYPVSKQSFKEGPSFLADAS